jgi:hypothetical protein
VRINPDAKIMSTEPLHPAFTTFVSSAAFIHWKPTAYDENRIAGRFCGVAAAADGPLP